MASSFRPLILFPLVTISLLASSCQDHHWTPYNELGPLPAPEKVIQGSIASGKVELGEKIKTNDYSGWTLFLVARPQEGASMFAAAKETVQKFPISFDITTKNIMVGKPKPSEKYIVEAILDKDGSIDTQEDTIISGTSSAPVELGAANLLITMDEQKREK